MARHCTDTSCSGTFEDGFCDNCGRAEPVGAAATGATLHTAREGGYSRQALPSRTSVPVTTGRLTGARRPTPTGATTPGTSPGTSPATSPGSRSGRTLRSRGSSSRRQALGGGLVQMPIEPSRDPLLLVMADARVPDGKAACPACGNKVNPDKRFCSNCGAEYDFRPSLKSGDVLAGQYEVRGPIAFGGLGWIYLAMDTRLNRWVVLKGLLNSRDTAAAAAAVAERQFLAAVKHGRIVGIYTFVTRDEGPAGAESFIVMEYVGGRTLKAIRRERGPLPPAEAMALVLGILPAFGYLHAQGLVYCDFKPDNFMLEGDDVKLIDLGAVRRVGDPHGDIYGTVGYKAPEADDDPDAASDLYTVARTLAVLLMDFDVTGRYAAALPPPNELLHTVPDAVLRAAGLDPAQALRATAADGGPLPTWLRLSGRSFAGTAPPGVTALEVRLGPEGGAATLPVVLTLPLAANESLYRFLLRATAAAPDSRFQTADDMAAQLTGVLRETVARTGPVPAMDSALFLPERAAAEDPALADHVWRRLPELRLTPTDPAAAQLFAARSAEPAQRDAMMATAMRDHPGSAEARLRRAAALIGDGAGADEILPLLDAAAGIDPFDWRPDWYCGIMYLSQARPADAVECFDKVYGEIPGEAVPKLALGLALEAEGRGAEATGLFDTVSRADPALPAAAFGLARCRLEAGDRAGAIDALSRVPDSAALTGEARLAAVRALSDPGAHEAELRQAAAILETMTRNDVARHAAEAALATAAARRAEAAPFQPAPFLGVAATARALRLRAERALLACARLSESPAARIAFVDQANAVRPRTWL